jgi:pilus assembly protein CpaC
MEQNGTRRRLYLMVLIGVVLALGGPPSHGAQGQQCKPVPSKPLTLTVNKTRVITLGQAVGKISVGTPNIANIPEIPKEAEREAANFIIVGSGQILLVGKSPGTTNLIVWGESGCVVAIYDVEVIHDLSTLQAKLHELMPDEKDIKIHTSQNAIILSGEVSNLARMNTALKLARTFAPKSQTRGPAVSNPGSDQGDGKQQAEDNVINMLQVGGVQQVMLEIKVAEVQRSVLKKLGISTTIFSPQGRWGFGAVKGGAQFPNADFGGTALDGGIPLIGPNTGTNLPHNPIVGPLLDLFEPATPKISDAGLFIYSLSKNLLFSVVIDALKENGLAKLLAEPNLTTLSGQEAQFHSGGEFPIPLDTGNNAITVEFKEFGIAVNFLPVILDSQRISLRTNISVSDILQTQTANIGVPGTNTVFVVPSLASRSAASTVELADGQTIAIAGLINDRVREASDKLPGLGEIPVLGLLFSSEEFRKDQTELVIFVTPRLAQPIPPQQVRLPTEAFVEPSEVDFYLMGKLEGKRQPQLFDPQTQGGGMEGDFGHGL